MDLLEAVRSQARACERAASPMYADILARVADDIETGGPAAGLLEPYADRPGPDALALRLMGSVHRLVLQRRAGSLAMYYPSVGGTYEAHGCWSQFRSLIGDQPALVAQWLDRPPQTNEVGRSTALWGGLRSLGSHLPVRLFEIGSSAGLNLLVDVYDFHEDSWVGEPPGTASPRIVERLGSDVMPIDPRSADGRLALTAYVWADQAHRHERLRQALAVAARRDVEVRRASAADFVAALSVVTARTTVLWHSVVWQYLDGDEQDAVTGQIARLSAAATDEAPFAHLYVEPAPRVSGDGFEFPVVLQEWPGGVERRLGTTVAHGVPTTWGPSGGTQPTTTSLTK